MDPSQTKRAQTFEESDQESSLWVCQSVQKHSGTIALNGVGKSGTHQGCQGKISILKTSDTKTHDIMIPKLKEDL